MVRTLFVLDFDGTYDFEEEGSYGVEPLVYLVPEDRMFEIELAAIKASKNFHNDENEMCIGDLFEEELEAKGIEFQQVGSLHIPFEERQENYLADYIPREIV